MRNLPRAIVQVLRPFELLFSERVWEWAKTLLIGAILAPGKRTVTAALRVMGLSDEAQFQNNHRVLNRAVWSPYTANRTQLRLLLDAFVPPDAPVLLGLDDHIERRRGTNITAKGISRDPVRSSRSFFVTTSGLRWLCMMLLAPIPRAQRVWALPFLTVQAPGAAEYRPGCKPHADCGVVRVALAGGGHLRGSAGALGHRDPASMVGSRYPAHHAGAVGVVLARDAVRPSPASKEASCR